MSAIFHEESIHEVSRRYPFWNITVPKFKCPKSTKRAITQKKIHDLLFLLLFFPNLFYHHPLSAVTSFKFLVLKRLGILHLHNFFPCFSKGCNFKRGDNSEKIIRVCYFSMTNSYMKFQGDIMMLHTYIQTDKPKPICSPLKLGA